MDNPPSNQTEEGTKRGDCKTGESEIHGRRKAWKSQKKRYSSNFYNFSTACKPPQNIERMNTHDKLLRREKETNRENRRSRMINYWREPTRVKRIKLVKESTYFLLRQIKKEKFYE